MTSYNAQIRTSQYVSQPQDVPAAPHGGLVSITAEIVSGRAGRVHAIADRVSALANRIYGHRPQPVSADGGTKDVGRQADADRLHQSIEFLDAGLARLEDELQRVEQL